MTKEVNIIFFIKLSYLHSVIIQFIENERQTKPNETSTRKRLIYITYTLYIQIRVHNTTAHTHSYLYLHGLMLLIQTLRTVHLVEMYSRRGGRGELVTSQETIHQETLQP